MLRRVFSASCAAPEPSVLGLPQKIAKQDFAGRGGTTKQNARRRFRRYVKSEVCADEGRDGAL